LRAPSSSGRRGIPPRSSAPSWRPGPLADLLQEQRPEIRRLLVAHALDPAELLGRARLPRGHLGQSAVVEDEIGRHLALARELASQLAELVEERAIDRQRFAGAAVELHARLASFPRLALGPGVERDRALALE